LQGQHKIARGYLPTVTYSNHLVRHPVAAQLVRRFLKERAAETEQVIEQLHATSSPFKTNNCLEAAVLGIRSSAEVQAQGDKDL
jgi:predicted N-acyltransferase